MPETTPPYLLNDRIQKKYANNEENSKILPRQTRPAVVPRRALKEFTLLPINYASFGPAATNALPAALPSYFTKFLMKRPARSCALPSQTETSA